MRTFSAQEEGFRKVEVERDAEKIIITYRMVDEYSAMMLYDQISDSLNRGRLQLDMTVTNGER